MKNLGEDQVQEPNGPTVKPSDQGFAGTLFHYFQKKGDTAKPSSPGVVKVIEDSDAVDVRSEDQKNGAFSSSKQSNNSHPSKCESFETTRPTVGRDKVRKNKSPPQQSRTKTSAADSRQLSGSEEKSADSSKDCKNGESEPRRLPTNDYKTRDSSVTKSDKFICTKAPSQNPFQIMMESGKKKGVWDKPMAKVKESQYMSSEDECIEIVRDVEHLESEVHDGAKSQKGSTEYFSIFSMKTSKAVASTSMNNHDRANDATKGGKSEKSTKVHESPKCTAIKNPSAKISCITSDASKASKRKNSVTVTEGSVKAKTRKHADCKLPPDSGSECSATPRKRNKAKSGDVNAFERDSHSTLKKKRLKVVSDSDFEPDDVQSSKRKDRTPSKSQTSCNKRPRTDSTLRTVSNPSSKPATLSAAKKLVKKSRTQQHRRSGDGARRESDTSTKPAPKQTLLTAAGRSGATPSDAGSPRRRSKRPQPSDSELEFTPGRSSRDRRKETEKAEVDRTNGRRSAKKRSRDRQAAKAGGNDKEVTSSQKSTRRSSTAGRRRHSSGTDIEVLSTKKKPDRRDADVEEPSRENRPQRRSSRPRRPMIVSDSEPEPSPVKKPSRRSRPARPPSPTDSEPETTPSRTPLRRSSRPSRPVRRLSDSEVELSPLKKPSRGGGRRSAAADEPEVVLVRSRSSGAASGRSARAGVDAFQMLKRGGRPSKQTAEEKAAEQARRAFLASGVPENLQVQAEVARRLEESLTPLFPEMSHVLQRSGHTPAPALPSSSLCAGLSWRPEPPLQPPVVGAAAAGGLVPGLAGWLKKAGRGQAAGVSAGGDSGAGDDTANPEKQSNPDKPAPPRLPDLSLPHHAASLRHLLSPSPTPSLWTDLFRPRHHAAFTGGSLPAEELQQWLEEWSPPAAWEDEDGSEEPAGDGTVLLVGPTGCGKTSAVYAAAAQLGFQVLEVSASHRRSGRHLSSQLSEATQSQRVSLPGGATSAAEPPSRSLLLLEDVQLVSEELDDGFIAAAASLAAAAKRPVVLTSDDPAATRGRLLRSLPHGLLTASAPPIASVRSYLALAALARGYLLPAAAASQLANSGDLRGALLKLQWLCEGQPDGQADETVDTWQALSEAQLEEVEELLDVLPAVLKVVRVGDGEGIKVGVAGLEVEAVGRRESGWRPPVRDATAGSDDQKRRRWRCVDPDLFSDEDDIPRSAPSPTPTPAPAPDPTPAPAEDRTLLSSSVTALATLSDLRSACDALTAPEPGVTCSWWKRGPQPDMSELEEPRCVAGERAGLLGRQMAEEALLAGSRRCEREVREARERFAACGRPEPESLRLVAYDEEGLRATAWEESSRLAPAVPSLLLGRRATAADLLPSIRRICRLECGRRATDGGRTRRFLHYFDQMGLHAVPTDLRTQICNSLM